MRKYDFHISIFCLTLFLLVFVVQNGFAGETSSGPDRVLGGHTFLVISNMADPFISTRFGSVTMGGIGNWHLGVDIPLQGSVVLTQGDYLLGIFGLGIDCQFQITDSMALRTALGGIILSGVNTNALLCFGASIAYAFSGGISLNVIRNRNFKLSLSADINQDNILMIRPGEFVAESLGAGMLKTDSLLDQTNATGITLGAEAAWALFDFLGSYGMIIYKYEFPPADSNILTPGIGISFDMFPLLKFPFGIGLNYKAAVDIEDLRYPTHNLGVGLFVTGRENILIGLEIIGNVNNIENIFIVSGLNAVFRIRYYW